MKDAISALASKEGVKWIRLEFLDYNNIFRSRELRPSYFSKIMSKGINFSKAIMDFTIFEDIVEDPKWGAETGDFFARPVGETYSRLSYLKDTVRVYCDLVEADGTPWEGCPRNCLKRVISRLKEELGISLLVGYEAEFYLVKKQKNSRVRFVPADDTKCFSNNGLETQEDILLNVMNSLEAAGVSVEKTTSEYGPGQYEMNFGPSAPMRAADNFVLFREIWQGIAHKRGLIATFMPKPFENCPGSGLHIHLSSDKAIKKSGGKDPFFRPSGSLSEIGLCFIAGLLAHARAISAFGNPTINSYKRLQPGLWAPALLTYGVGNRNSLIRIPDGTRRIEFRSPDSTSNPYLLLASILAAGYDGIERGLKPPQPISDDPSHLPVEELERRGIKRMPINLGESIEALRKNHRLRKILGNVLCKEFIKLRESEWERYSKQVTPWELDTYIETY